MNIQELLKEAAYALKKAQIENPRLEAEILLAHLLKKERFWFYTYPEAQISLENQNKYNELLQRRINKEPIAYIIGKKEFMGLDFQVAPGVLIPRPDTETLVETAMEIINSSLKQKYNKGELEVLDICCGSGAIGLSLKKEYSKLILTLSDVSEKAITASQINSKKLNLPAEIIQSDLFNSLEGTFDLILSNPPYIKTEEIKHLSQEIKNWEPHLALDGGVSGYDFYEKIIKESVVFLRAGGCLILEAGDYQAEKIIKILENYNFEKIGVKTDLRGIPRAVFGFRSILE